MKTWIENLLTFGQKRFSNMQGCKMAKCFVKGVDKFSSCYSATSAELYVCLCLYVRMSTA